MKQKPTITLLAAFIFLTLAITGVMELFFPFNSVMSNIHTFFGMLFILVVAMHIKFNFRPLTRYFSSRASWFSSIFVVLLIVGVLSNLSLFLFFSDLRASNLKHNNTDISTRSAAIGKEISIELYTGEGFVEKQRRLFRNTTLIPQLAIWLEDLQGNYLETLYVTEKSAKSNWIQYPFAKDKVRRPAALPYWSHKRGVKAEDGLYMPSEQTSLPDGMTSATPISNFVLTSKIPPNLDQYRILLEINKSWDYNFYYTEASLENSLLPHERRSFSGQPALVYSAVIESTTPFHVLTLAGHSDPTGESGMLFVDVSKLDSALNLVKRVIVHLPQ